jgi:hypothetical protein
VADPQGQTTTTIAVAARVNFQLPRGPVVAIGDEWRIWNVDKLKLKLRGRQKRVQPSRLHLYLDLHRERS